MCELFGVTGTTPVVVNDYLREFFSHSEQHPDGWGLAVFYGDAVSLEKEPETATKSAYLKSRLKHDFRAMNIMAHIRLATKGNMDYENCHPFVKRDQSGRAWTLMHNGTIFESAKLDEYINQQVGATDSERILCYIIDRVNQKHAELGHPLNAEERFQLIDEIVCEITPPNNKVNLIIYDTELYYVHTNFRNTLYMRREGEATFFSTTPLLGKEWEATPFCTLLAYKDGILSYTGTTHQNEYFL